MDRLRDFAPGLDGDEIPAAGDTDGDVAQLAFYRAAVPVPQPSEFRKEEAAVPLIELELFGVGITEAFVVAFFSKLRRSHNLIRLDLPTVRPPDLSEIKLTRV